MNKLKDTKTLALAAMLTAIGIILGFLKLPITQMFEIRFGGLSIAMAGMMLGPIPAAVVGALVDVGGFLVKPTGPYFPGFTLSGIVGGLIFGFFLYGKKTSFIRVLCAETVYTVVVGMGLNTLWLSLLYLKNGYIAALVTRAPKEILMIPIYSFIYYFVLFTCERFKYLFLKTA